MKIIASSDFHGDLPYIKTPFDLFLICGDICPAHDHYYNFQVEWFKNEFCDWINRLPFKDEDSKVVLTWGNHDFVGERIDEGKLASIYKKTNNRLIVLNNSECEFKGLKIFGTPYCKLFGRWAFMLPNDALCEKYAKIGTDVDILISHDSPMIDKYGMIQEGWSAGHDAGNPILAGVIRDRKPKMAFFGHIHSHDHGFRKIGDTWMAGVSYVNESYTPAYMPLEFDYEDGNVVIPEIKWPDSDDEYK